MTEATPPLVSIIIPVFNLWDYTFRCLQSVQRHTSHIPHEVIVVDDASTDESREALPMLQGITLIRNTHNEGFAHNNNKAAAVARGKYILFLNNDTEVHAGWLDALCKEIEGKSDVGMVGSKLLFPDGTIQHAGVGFSYGAFTPISPFHMHYKKPATASTSVLELNAVTAACALMPKHLFLRLGGFDEGFRMGYEDVDLCLRVRSAGYRIIYTPASVVTHFESLSAGRFVASRRNTELLHTKWLGRMNAFESDYRTISRPVVADATRPGCSVVVAVHDQISTVAPCLESVWHTLGPQDELIVVDDGSSAATAKYLALFVHTHAARAVLIRLDGWHGLSAAWQVGVARANRAYVALLVCNLRILEGSFDRLVRHLEGNPSVGALCAVEADADGLPTQRLLAPFPASEGGLTLPAALSVGDVVATDLLASGLVAGERGRLGALLSACPGGVPGGHPAAWSRVLQAQGKTLAVAPDVTAYPLNQIFPSSGMAARQAYLRNLSTALDAASRPQAHAALASVVVVVRDCADGLAASLQALCAKTPGGWELIVVDDGSIQSVAAVVQTMVASATISPPTSARLVRHQTPQGWAAAVNAGLALCEGRVVAVLNADVLVTPQWLLRMTALLDVNGHIGLVAPAANVGPRPQCCEEPNFTTPAMSLDDFAAQRAPEFVGAFGGMPRVAGFCLAIKREVIQLIGGFDPRYGDTNADVEDFCVRVSRAGYLIALASDVYVEHLGKQPARWLDLHPRRAPSEGWLRFCERWHHPVHASDTDGLGMVLCAEPPFDRATQYVPLTSGAVIETAPPLSTPPFVATAAR
ncbi:MAG: glycosyltransferase family 2 protein [Deltaproteobacteria bacterium]|nr:glycosyltransferase family 2 protein [Deltaproteobacteria bacterium]